VRSLLVSFLALPMAAQQVEFNRDVRPIFSDHCFMCHGPDAAHREAGVRFDVEGDAQRLQSEILARTASTDPGEQMPPPHSGKPRLTDKERSALTRWFAEGALWQPFWSFIPPKRTAGKSLDDMVSDRLQRAGLHAAPAAEPHLLIRRVSLDLTGLPPTLAQVDEFVRNPSDSAYERVVDRLLASPRYGSGWRFAGWRRRAMATATDTRRMDRAICGAGGMSGLSDFLSSRERQRKRAIAFPFSGSRAFGLQLDSKIGSTINPPAVTI